MVGRGFGLRSNPTAASRVHTFPPFAEDLYSPPHPPLFYIPGTRVACTAMPKNYKTTVRHDENLEEVLKGLQNEWGLDSKSETVRILIEAFAGLVHGNLWAMIDTDKLQAECGEIGSLLASSVQHNTLPDSIKDLRLESVISDVNVLVGAANVDLKGGGDT